MSDDVRMKDQLHRAPSVFSVNVAICRTRAEKWSVKPRPRKTQSINQLRLLSLPEASFGSVQSAILEVHFRRRRHRNTYRHDTLRGTRPIHVKLKTFCEKSGRSKSRSPFAAKFEGSNGSIEHETGVLKCSATPDGSQQPGGTPLANIAIDKGQESGRPGSNQRPSAPHPSPDLHGVSSLAENPAPYEISPIAAEHNNCGESQPEKCNQKCSGFDTLSGHYEKTAPIQ